MYDMEALLAYDTWIRISIVPTAVAYKHDSSTNN